MREAGLDAKGIVAKVFEALGKDVRSTTMQHAADELCSGTRLRRSSRGTKLSELERFDEERLTMKVILAQPRGFCAGVVRAIEIVERALQKYGAAGLRAPRDRAQQARGREPEGEGRAFRRGAVAKSRRRRHDLLRARRRQERRGGGRGARSAGAQRDLSAGHQGPQPGQALRRPGPHADPDRPCRPSRSRRHDGPDPGAGASWCRTKPTSQRSTSRRTTPVAYVTQTTLSVDDTKGIIAALQRRFTDHRRSGNARHLLRYPESPDRGARAQQAGRRDPGGRRARTAPTPTVCAKSARRRACRAI